MKPVTTSLDYYREYWTGDSRDGALVNGDGWHYFAMDKNGTIIEAYEFYETEQGDEVAAPLPEMEKVNWLKDLGFEDYETLEVVTEDQFSDVRMLASN